jgi:hypothetical protein
VVADHVQMFGAGRVGLDIREQDLTGLGPQQTGHGAQQAGLARAVASGQGDRLAGGKLQVQPREQPPLSSRNGQILYENSSQHAKTLSRAWTFKTSKAKKPSAVTLQTVRGVRGRGWTLWSASIARSREWFSGGRGQRRDLPNGVFGQP